MEENLSKIDDLERLLDEGDQKFKETYNSSVVFFGQVGHGKTGLLNFIKSKNSDEIKVLDNKENNFETGDGTKLCTKTPNFYELEDDTYCDLPGFSKTNTHFEEIARFYFLQRIFESSNLVKIVLVLKHGIWEGEGNKLINIFEELCRMFSDKNSLYEVLSIVIVGSDEDFSVCNFREELFRIANENKRCSHLKEFLLNIVDTQDKMCIFYRPNPDEGSLDYDQKESILSCIETSESRKISLALKLQESSFITNKIAEKAKATLELELNKLKDDYLREFSNNDSSLLKLEKIQSILNKNSNKDEMQPDEFRRFLLEIIKVHYDPSLLTLNSLSFRVSFSQLQGHFNSDGFLVADFFENLLKRIEANIVIINENISKADAEKAEIKRNEERRKAEEEKKRLDEEEKKRLDEEKKKREEEGRIREEEGRIRRIEREKRRKMEEERQRLIREKEEQELAEKRVFDQEIIGKSPTTGLESSRAPLISKEEFKTLNKKLSTVNSSEGTCDLMHTFAEDKTIPGKKCELCEDKVYKLKCIYCQTSSCEACAKWYNDSKPLEEPENLTCHRGHSMRMTVGITDYYNLFRKKQAEATICDGCKEKTTGNSAHCRKCRDDYCETCLNNIGHISKFIEFIRCERVIMKNNIKVLFKGKLPKCPGTLQWENITGGEFICNECSTKYSKSGAYKCKSCNKKYCISCARRKKHRAEDNL